MFFRPPFFRPLPISSTRSTRSISYIGSIGILILLGCKPLPPSKPASAFTLEESRGSQVFQRDCARCHYPTSTRGLKGPGLQALTKLKAMPSGAPPTDERLTYTILHGRGMMPAVPINDNDLQTLLAYLHTL